MRVVLIGVSHWHTPFFLNPCLEMPDVTIVGVSDPDLARTEAAAAQGGLPGVHRLSGDVRDTEAGLCLRACAGIATWPNWRGS